MIFVFSFSVIVFGLCKTSHIRYIFPASISSTVCHILQIRFSSAIVVLHSYFLNYFIINLSRLSGNICSVDLFLCLARSFEYLVFIYNFFKNSMNITGVLWHKILSNPVTLFIFLNSLHNFLVSFTCWSTKQWHGHKHIQYHLHVKNVYSFNLENNGLIIKLVPEINYKSQHFTFFLNRQVRSD